MSEQPLGISEQFEQITEEELTEWGTRYAPRDDTIYQPTDWRCIIPQLIAEVRRQRAEIEAALQSYSDTQPTHLWRAIRMAEALGAGTPDPMPEVPDGEETQDLKSEIECGKASRRLLHKKIEEQAKEIERLQTIQDEYAKSLGLEPVRTGESIEDWLGRSETDPSAREQPGLKIVE